MKLWYKLDSSRLSLQLLDARSPNHQEVTHLQ